MRAGCGLPLLPVGDCPWKLGWTRSKPRMDGLHLDRLIQSALALRYRACPNCTTKKPDYHRYDRRTTVRLVMLTPYGHYDLISPSVDLCVVHPSHSFLHASSFLIACTHLQACIPLCILSLLSLRSFYHLYAPTVNAVTPSTPLSTLISSSPISFISKTSQPTPTGKRKSIRYRLR